MNKNNDTIEPIEIFAGTAWEAGLIKSLLENAEIEAFLLDEIRGTLIPFHLSAGGAEPVKVLISSTDFVKGKQVVDEYLENQKKS